MSVVVEWRPSASITATQPLRLGWDRVLGAADTAPSQPAHDRPRDERGASSVETCCPRRPTPTSAPSASPIHGRRSIAAGLVRDPDRSGRRADGVHAEHAPLRLRLGDAAMIPHGVGETTFSGHGTSIRCLPPDPGTEDGRRDRRDRTPILEARDIVKTYGHVNALEGANFSVHPGEVVALIGDNGAGKSTLTKIISGVVTPDSGELLFEGTPVEIELSLRRAGAGNRDRLPGPGAGARPRRRRERLHGPRAAEARACWDGSECSTSER